MTDETFFTADEYREEHRRFMKMLGELSFWKRPDDQRQAALDGLGHMFMRVRTDSETEKLVGRMHQLALQEFIARDVLWALRPL